MRAIRNWTSIFVCFIQLVWHLNNEILSTWSFVLLFVLVEFLNNHDTLYYLFYFLVFYMLLGL